MKVNVLCSREGAGFHVDSLELYSARQRTQYVTMAAHELCVEQQAIRRDLGQVLLKLEELQERAAHKADDDKTSRPKLSDEERGLEWRPKASSLFEHTRLKKLFINKYPAKTLTVLSKMTGLRSLSLASPKIETLNGIDALSELSFLGVYLARQLRTLNGIEALMNLVQLEAASSPCLGDRAARARDCGESSANKRLTFCRCV